jgi:uncharacterized protein with PIN domain
VLCDTSLSDAELAECARRERRILLTADRGLLKRRSVTGGMLVRSQDPDEQLGEVVARFRLAPRLRPFTRCTACNGVLAGVDKASVADRLQPRTRAGFERFWRCPACGRIYWEGSHHPRLLGLVKRARAGGTAAPG